MYLPFLSLCAFPARIGKMKRRKPEEGGQVCPLCSAPLAGSEEEMSRHVEQCLIQVVQSGPWTLPTAGRTACQPFPSNHFSNSCRCHVSPVVQKPTGSNCSSPATPMPLNLLYMVVLQSHHIGLTAWITKAFRKTVQWFKYNRPYFDRTFRYTCV